MILLSNISKSFDNGATFAVKNLTLKIKKGETVVLLGSSGSGKTTTLKMINRLIEPTKGFIKINGTKTSELNPVELRRSIGYVFQGIGLFPHMTVRKNLEIIPRLLGWPKKKRHKRAMELLEIVGLEPENYSDRLPDELSGGEQQRIGVARALASNPTCMLMDEPFGALDALTRDALQQELLSLKKQLKKTIVFVTHDIFEALTLGDKIAILHKGFLEQTGTKEEILSNPQTDFVRNLFAKPAKQLADFKDIF